MLLKISRAFSLSLLAGFLAAAPERATAQGLSRDLAAESSPALPPRTPRGMPACEAPIVPSGSFLARPGENIEYDVEVMGLDVGTLELNVSRRGVYRGEPVTELKSAVKINKSVAMFVPLEGAAASLVSEQDFGPVQATARYRWFTNTALEQQTFQGRATQVAARQVKNDEVTDVHRTFHAQVFDIVSGFNFLRQLPAAASGCTLLFTGGKPYTVWLEPEGDETLAGPSGPLAVTRYHIRYASDEAKLIREARIWVTKDARRLPARAEGLNSYHPLVTLKSYAPGR